MNSVLPPLIRTLRDVVGEGHRFRVVAAGSLLGGPVFAFVCSCGRVRSPYGSVDEARIGHARHLRALEVDDPDETRFVRESLEAMDGAPP